MHQISLFLAALAPAAVPATSNPEEAIIVTGTREPMLQKNAPLSSTIIAETELERLALPLASDVLRLVPGLTVAVSGTAGSQTQVRIRGSEANHSLLLVDGIRFNDPAAGNEARFELLAVDGLSRIEVIRGPQSALWGSEAIGAVIAVETANPLRAEGFAALGEYGSLDSLRASARGAVRIGSLGISGGADWLHSDGIDAFGSGGERDGFDNRTASLKLALSPGPDVELGAVGHWVESESQFDDLDPASFLRADTLHGTANQMLAGRIWGRVAPGETWSLSAGASLLHSSNRNRLGPEPLNRTFGQRATFDAQLSAHLRLAGARHRLTLAGEHRDEDFRARDQQFFGATNQDRSRKLTALTAEWQAEWQDRATANLALRHDSFSAFADATTLRASLLVRLAGPLSIHGAYGEGIAQPSFYDLYGFFPRSFVGNPALVPESSTSWEAGLRWNQGRTTVAVTGFRARLHDEIVPTFDPATFISSAANAAGTSRRHGLELEARRQIGRNGLIAFNYSWLDADERQTAAAPGVREVRRPRHSANVLAALELGPAKLGASLAYVGERRDVDFESFPARDVTLGDYLLGSLSLAWPLADGFELYGRIENVLGEDYEDVFGYETPGRRIYAGLRLRLGD